MKLSKIQFDVLMNIEANKNKEYSLKEILKDVNYSLESIVETISELLKLNYIDKQNKITELGLKALEPYRVKRAIFLAAGFGSRMVPITLSTPKPLVFVHGKRIIETLLDAVVDAGIEEIYIVRGYLGEQFDVLLQKYPNIKFIENRAYNEANNISSALLVKDLLQNAYVLESDLVLSNPKIIRKYEYSSNFLGFYVEKSDDWCMEVNDGIITSEKQGGCKCYQMIGISYYDKEDGQKLAKDIEKVFNMPGGKEKYWEQVQLDIKKDDYKISLRECYPKDIIEIDTFNELKAIDESYCEEKRRSL